MFLVCTVLCSPHTHPCGESPPPQKWILLIPSGFFLKSLSDLELSPPAVASPVLLQACGTTSGSRLQFFQQNSHTQHSVTAAFVSGIGALGFIRLGGQCAVPVF